MKEVDRIVKSLIFLNAVLILAYIPMVFVITKTDRLNTFFDFIKCLPLANIIWVTSIVIEQKYNITPEQMVKFWESVLMITISVVISILVVVEMGGYWYILIVLLWIAIPLYLIGLLKGGIR